LCNSDGIALTTVSSVNASSLRQRKPVTPAYHGEADDDEPLEDALVRGALGHRVAFEDLDEDAADGHEPHGSKPKQHKHSHVHHMTEAEVRLMSSYESLDYDVPQSELFRRDRIHLDQRMNVQAGYARWVIFALVGILTGTLAYVLNLGVGFLSDLKFDSIRTRVESGELVGPFFIFLGFTVLYVAISSFLVAFIEPVASGSGIPEVKAFLNGTNYLRFLRLKTLLVKAVGVIFSVSGGLAIGKEGPLVHSGAVIAANLSHQIYIKNVPCLPDCWRRWIYRFRNDRDKRDFVSGGAAAGVAAAFGAPVGGILFSLEEASSFWSVDLTWRVFLCSMLGTFFLNIWKVIATGKDSFSGLISFGPALQGTPFRTWELPFFLILAVFGGLVGACFNAINVIISKWRREHLAGRPWRRWGEAIVVALLTGILSFWAPYFLPRCHIIPQADINTMNQLGINFFSQYQCPPGQYNSMASMVFTTTEISIRGFFHNTAIYDWDALLAYFVIIFFLAVITYGIAVPSGLFVPCILMGCAFGRLLGEGMRYAFPDSGIIPGTYALIGATAVLGGVSRMTISLTVILLETTNDVQYIMVSELCWFWSNLFMWVSCSL
jgi:chloride channel 7